MTEPKNFQKGKHTYTRYGSNFKEVHVPGKPKTTPSPQSSTELSIDVDPNQETGVYANLAAAHRSPEEVVLDFCFLPPGQTRARVRSRIILSHKQVKQLAELLQHTVEEINKSAG